MNVSFNFVPNQKQLEAIAFVLSKTVDEVSEADVLNVISVMVYNELETAYRQMQVEYAPRWTDKGG